MPHTRTRSIEFKATAVILRSSIQPPHPHPSNTQAKHRPLLTATNSSPARISRVTFKPLDSTTLESISCSSWSESTAPSYAPYRPTPQLPNSSLFSLFALPDPQIATGDAPCSDPLSAQTKPQHLPSLLVVP